MKLQTNIIHEGDCLDIMKSMPDESIKLVVTSPPYNIRNSLGSGLSDNRPKGKWPNNQLQYGYEDHDDNMPHDEYVAWQRECLSEMMRLIRPDGAIFYNHKWRVQNGLIQDRSDITEGFPIRQIIIWHRSGGFNFTDTFYLPNYEVIYLIAKPDFKVLRSAVKEGCVWRIHQNHNNPHPAPFPVELPMKCVMSISEGPVLDPFMGSGTTAVACERLGVKWIGIEKSRKYIDMAEQRINQENMFNSIFQKTN